MMTFLRHGNGLVKLTLAIACLALAILWPQWRVALQTNGYYPPGQGRMTGGGNCTTVGDIRVRHGFELHCDASDEPNNLQVTWTGGNRFHLTELTDASCPDTALDERPPFAGFDTYVGEGIGRYNGVDGATAF